MFYFHLFHVTGTMKSIYPGFRHRFPILSLYSRNYLHLFYPGFLSWSQTIHIAASEEGTIIPQRHLLALLYHSKYYVVMGTIQNKDACLQKLSTLK